MGGEENHLRVQIYTNKVVVKLKARRTLPRLVKKESTFFVSLFLFLFRNDAMRTTPGFRLTTNRKDFSLGNFQGDSVGENVLEKPRNSETVCEILLGGSTECYDMMLS